MLSAVTYIDRDDTGLSYRAALVFKPTLRELRYLSCYIGLVHRLDDIEMVAHRRLFAGETADNLPCVKTLLRQISVAPN
jgi:hypothetical protein